MAAFVLERIVPAPAAAVFDVSLDVDLHVASQSSRSERAVAGKTTGSLGEGDEVTWSARHFGLRFRLSSVVFDVQRPLRFRDRQTKGPFASFVHTHDFTPVDGGTLMRDTIEFRSPLGAIGQLVDKTIMRRHLIAVITERNDAISRHFS